MVIGDPHAKADDPVVKVKVKGVEDIQWTQEEKEREKLPICKVNPNLLKKIKANELGIITLRFRQEDKKINITCRAQLDNNLPEDQVLISLELLGEKVGAEEAEAEAFRAKAWQIHLKGAAAERLIGLKIGDKFDGSIVGLPGVELEIRGGSDNSGFPMHPGIPGGVKKKVLLSGPPGFHPREKGERRRKTVRGNTIVEDIVQINTRIVYPPHFKPLIE
ncbi:Ribosomal protein S6e [Pyrolobus fumarii 1A]|uniref:Small ribosomal subunit protein eS6 n=1 Tax=Pyrolobus fumarii (strain DSM 11204 / 1A) TaxID=694429 RepID=G0EH34_PYRF1|nr:Ribosomal protein S6e [Pyrolobus fumarii 1A]